MRIAYTCVDPGVPVFGHKGCSVHVREMCSTMLEAGHDVTLLTTRRGGAAPDSLRGMPVVDVPMPAAADAGARELESIAANEGVMQALERAGPFVLI
jgi:hypothetical protein